MLWDYFLQFKNQIKKLIGRQIHLFYFLIGWEKNCLFKNESVLPLMSISPSPSPSLPYLFGSIYRVNCWQFPVKIPAKVWAEYCSFRLGFLQIFSLSSCSCMLCISHTRCHCWYGILSTGKVKSLECILWMEYSSCYCHHLGHRRISFCCTRWRKVGITVHRIKFMVWYGILGKSLA